MELRKKVTLSACGIGLAEIAKAMNEYEASAVKVNEKVDWSNAIIDVASVAGIVKRCEQVQTNYGESTRFRGQFVMKTLPPFAPMEVRASVAFFPAVLEGELVANVKEDSEMMFAGVLTVRRITSRKGVGVEYGYRSAIKMAEESDPLSKLLAQTEVPKQLPEADTAELAKESAGGEPVVVGAKKHAKK